MLKEDIFFGYTLIFLLTIKLEDSGLYGKYEAKDSIISISWPGNFFEACGHCEVARKLAQT